MQRPKSNAVIEHTPSPTIAPGPQAPRGKSGVLPHILYRLRESRTVRISSSSRNRSRRRDLPVLHAFRSLISPELSIVQILPQADRVVLVARQFRERAK